MLLKDEEILDSLGNYLPPSDFTYDFAQQRLDISVPQQYVKKIARRSVQPEEWEDGINAAFVNYAYSGSQSWGNGRRDSNYLSLRNGVNWGAWRLRNFSTWSQFGGSNRWKGINTYLQRDIKPLKSQIVIGESQTASEVFDSFAFRGVQIFSEEGMEPESILGFAPVIRGVARSNAQVTVRQDGNIIYQSYVPPGPFSISDLYPTSLSGDLQISIREADGTTKQFTQGFSAVPIMLREGRFKYSVTAGQYRATNGAEKKPIFIQTNTIVGLPRSSTLYGGSIISKDYQAASLGVGKGLGSIGAVSFDSTWATTKYRDQRSTGASFRIQYSKNIVASGTSFTLAGYRYSTSGYYDFNEANGNYAINNPEKNQENDKDDAEQEKWQYYSSRRGQYNKRSKAQLNVNQSLGDWGNIYLAAYQQSYWGSSNKENNLSLGYGFNYNSINYSLNYTWSKSPYYKNTEQVISLAVQIPLNHFLTPNSWMNVVTGMTGNNVATASTGISGTALADNNFNYNLQQGYTSQGAGVTGNIAMGYKASFGEYQAGYNYTRQSSQVNYGAAGGIVLHPDGVILSQSLGDTFAIIKAENAQQVKVRNNPGIYTDNKGYAVIPYVSPYRRNALSLDANELTEKLDILNDTQTVIPTKGAIVMAEFLTAYGQKIMLTLNSTRRIPFGATAKLKNNDPVPEGIVDDRQRVFLSGVPAEGKVIVEWKGNSCEAAYSIIENNGAAVNFITSDCR